MGFNQPSTSEITENKEVRLYLSNFEYLILQELSDSIKSETQETIKEESESNTRFLSDFLADILYDLASANWQQRHGASLALCSVVSHALSM